MCNVKMTDDKPYTPIPCALYDTYELAIMHNETLRLAWQDAAGQDHIALLRPYDLQTRKDGEYLLARDDNDTPLCIRLDYIRSNPALTANDS